MPLLDLRSLWERVPAVVTPDTVSLTLATFAPAVSTPLVVTPANAGLVLTGFAPVLTVTTNVRIIPASAALILTGYVPTVTTVRLAEGGPYVQEPGWHRRRPRVPERVPVHQQVEPTVVEIAPEPEPVLVAIDDRAAIAAALLAAGAIEEEQFAALLAA